ncbi:hypothetical protein AAG570_011210 [Ranatra chinensis]|uniref:Major facilitator superfamily (MFS) profile domain-containing protein n=1 Tax=Ranatra chinensis TaxID=642074 RepID=A0ABD0YJX9_9HEMI
MVTFVCFSASFTLDSASYAFHAFEIPLGHQLNVKGSSVAVIMAVYLCCSYVAGPLASGIANRYGFRITMMLGSSMGFVGMLCSYFAVDNYEYYIFFFGILSGIGADMLFVTSMVAVGFWFEKRRATAIGISTCGTGMTAIITPVIANYITKNFGWRIVFALLSGEPQSDIQYGRLLLRKK